MKREPQVYNIVSQDYWKDCHNPIYEILKSDFDDIFLQKTINEEDVDGQFYVDARLREGASNEKIIHHWNPSPDTITSAAIFKKGVNKNGLIYFLLGRKGIGKSSLLVHFIEGIRTEENVLPIYLDLKNQKSNSNFLSNLHSKIYTKIYNRIKSKKLLKYEYLTDIKLVRELDSRFVNLSDDTLAKMLLNDHESIISEFFNYLEKQNIKIYLIIDNVDDWPIKAVNSIIDVCHVFKTDFNIKSIIALRDYWTPKNLALNDYNYASLLLSKPDFLGIINKRLDLLSPEKNTQEFKLFLYDSSFIVITRQELIDIYRDLVKQIHEDRKLQNTLFNLSNCNTREYIKYIFYFFHSIYLSAKPCFENLLSQKICEHIPEFEILPTRKLKLHDFLSNNMAIHSLCYDTENSLIFNLFHHKYNYSPQDEFRASLIFLRILKNISIASHTEKNVLIANLNQLGYPKDAIRDALKVLLENNFIESPEGASMSDIQNIYLTIKGKTYIEVVLYEYNYYLYISDVVPMPDKYKVSVKEKYGEEDIPIARGSLLKKNEAVRNLILFLKDEEDDEEQNVNKTKLSILENYKDDSLFDNITIEIERTIEKLFHGHPNRKRISDKIIQKITLK